MKMLIVTGGTGGHIYPALALADEAVKRYKNLEILFVGNDDRMETRIIPNHGYEFIGLHASGLSGGIAQKGKAVYLMLKAYWHATDIIKEFAPDVVIGFGGYVSAPVMLAASRKHIPTMIHEQNSVVGVANKVVANKVDAIVICYERLFEQFDKQKTKLLGNPRATSAVNTPFDKAYYQSLKLDKNKPLILVVMGSLGSTSMNSILCEALLQVDKRYQILFVTGKNNYDEVTKQMEKRDNIHIVDYVKQLEIMEKVDLIICRAGATTAAEITALGCPSIIVPSPYVAHNHQFYNANVLVEHKAAFMIEEKDLNVHTLNKKIAMIMENDKLRKEMAEAAKELGFPSASRDILTWIDDMKKVNDE